MSAGPVSRVSSGIHVGRVTRGTTINEKNNSNVWFTYGYAAIYHALLGWDRPFCFSIKEKAILKGRAIEQKTPSSTC